MEEGDRRPFIVVCPMSVLANWQIEIENWTSLKAIQWYGNSDKRKFTAQMVKNQGMAGLYSTLPFCHYLI